jgi:hypothetical protein
MQSIIKIKGLHLMYKIIIMEIYKTTNKITGEYYIGLNTTSNPNYLGSGVEIKKQVRKYGKENFTKEILCLVTSSSTDENILRKIEHAYISNHIKDKNCINISLGYQKNKKEIEVKYIEKIVEVEKIKYVDKIETKYIRLKPLGRGLSALLH